MTDSQLDSVVARTGHVRFRALVADDNPDAAQREAYRDLVRRLFLGEAPAVPAPAVLAATLPADLALLKRARVCGNRTPSDCGCDFGTCSRLGLTISAADCLACLRAGDDAGAAPPSQRRV